MFKKADEKGKGHILRKSWFEESANSNANRPIRMGISRDRIRIGQENLLSV